MTERFQGTCKWFNALKGYGFIVPARVHGSGKDLFVHINALNGLKSLNEGQAVSYEIGEDRDGRMMAKNVQV